MSKDLMEYFIKIVSCLLLVVCCAVSFQSDQLIKTSIV